MADLTSQERAELERYRRSGSRAARRGRWAGATTLLIIGAVLASIATAAVYLRGQVLDTNTYVETVAPLGEDPAVRSALATRLTDEIMTRSDVAGIVSQLAAQLEAQGAPAQLSELTGPVVDGVSSFLRDKITALLATNQFETAWINANRVAHDALITILTEREGQIVSSEGDRVVVDLGAMLTLLKQQFVAEGLTIFARIPDMSIPYTLVQSDQLPKLRTYTHLLDIAGQWLPWVALGLLVVGIVLAPDRRRGILVGAVLVAVVAALALAALSIARTVYIDDLPSSVVSPAAATVVIDTMLRFLISALQALLTAALVFTAGALLAGPSRWATSVRHVVGGVLNALSSALARTGSWVIAVGHAVRPAYHPIQVLLVVAAVVVLVFAERPSWQAVLWTTLVVLAVLAVLEVFVRAVPRSPA